jgi:hypothetical protein
VGLSPIHGTRGGLLLDVTSIAVKPQCGRFAGWVIL